MNGPIRRLNKYLADMRYATRRGADELIERGLVFVNGKRAQIGQKVSDSDVVEVKAPVRSYRYVAYNKPRGIVTHSPQGNERDISNALDLPGLFPIGRLDKDSHGLIILTDDGRVTDRLLNPERDHEKEYIVTTVQKLRPSFASHMERGVDIGGYVTKKCTVRVLGDRRFSITLAEGKKHQIRRMCVALHTDVADLQRVRIMRISLGSLAPGQYRQLAGAELDEFLSDLGLSGA